MSVISSNSIAMKQIPFFRWTLAALTLMLVMAAGVSLQAQSCAPGAGHRQQARIHRGVQQGDLNRREAHRLRQQQRNLRHMENMAMADGRVTRKERKMLERERNRASQNIYRQRHDGQRRYQ